MDIPNPLPTPKSTLAQRIMERYRRLVFCYYVWSGYVNYDFEPIRCMECDWWSDFDDVVTDYVSYHPCEVKRVCPNCEAVMGYWAYGSWEPWF